MSSKSLSIRGMNSNFFYKYTLYILFAGLIIVSSLLSNKFYSFENLVSVLLTAAPLGIAAIGMTFVLLTGGLDLSVGSIVFTSGAFSVICGNAGWGLLPTLMISILTGAAIGLVNGTLIARYKMVPFLTTFATQTLLRGLILVLTKEGYISHKNHIFMSFITEQKLAGIPVIVFIFFLMAVAGQIILMRSAFGWRLYAVGNNEGAAVKLGIKSTFIIAATYVLCGALAGLSGFTHSGMIGEVTSNFGEGQEFTIISATVLGGVSLMGGKGSILPGVIFGVLIFVIIENVLVLVSANPYLYTIIRGIFIFFAVMLDCIKNSSDLR